MLFMKIMIVVCVVGMLRCSPRFQNMSRELDDTAIAAMKRLIQTAEESGFPPSTIPILILLTALAFMSIAVTMGGGR
jgi:hypothetical protein